MTSWADVNARARGLATHLLGRSRLAALASAADLTALADALCADGFLSPEMTPAEPAVLEQAVRRAAAARLHTLAWWCGTRTGLLAVIFEDEERRGLRRLLRGAVQGAPPEQRLAGIIPTPSLPEGALAELARQASVQRVAALLVAWKHPFGTPLLEAARAAHPDLLRLELALSRTFAERALTAARPTGRRGALVTYVREVIDTENGATAIVLALAGDAADVRPNDTFLPGGERLTIDAFEEAVSTHDAAAAAMRLARAFAGTPLQRVYREHAGDPAQIEGALLRDRIRRCESGRRRAPLGIEVLLGYALQLRAEVLDLHRIIWGVALGAPGGAIEPFLVSRS